MAPALPQLDKACIAIDCAPYKPAELNMEEEFGLFVTDFLVMMEACNHDLDRIRHGCTFVTQCRGMGWANFSAEIEKRSAALYDNCYPLRFGMLPLVDAPWIVNAMMAICRLVSFAAA